MENCGLLQVARAHVFTVVTRSRHNHFALSTLKQTLNIILKVPYTQKMEGKHNDVALCIEKVVINFGTVPHTLVLKPRIKTTQ